MSRKRLITTEMLQLSAEWLDPQSPAHSAILASTDLATNLPRIQSAHQELAIAANPTTLDPRLAAIIKEQTDLDDRHDDIIRGCHGFLTSIATLLGPTDGAQFIVLRDLLLPEGLSSLQKSYLAEAGHAAQVESQLTPEIRAQLTKLLVGPKTKQRPLLQFVEEWIHIGKQLGALENEKTRLAPAPDSISAGKNLVAARNKWLRAVNLFVAIAEAAELDPNADRIIFNPLRSAESKAAKRGRSFAPVSDENNETLADEPDNA